MKLVSRSITVGVVLTLLIVVAIVIYKRVPDSKVGGSFKTYAMLHDGSRLQPGSPVIIAGVRVGDITKLTIEGRLCRVDIHIQDYVRLPAETTFAMRRSNSLFGDSYLEIIPGPDEEGIRMLASGEQIKHVEEGGSTDRVLRSIARALPKIDNAMETVHERVVDLRPYVQGPLRQKLEDAERWLGQGHIEAPLTKADHALARLENGSRAIADAVHTTGRDVPDRIARWNKNVLDARTAMADAQVRIVKSLGDAREGMNAIDERVDQAAQIMGEINRGDAKDGYRKTVGSLVNDPLLAEDIEDVTESLKEATASFDRFKALLGARMELNYYSGRYRFYASAEIKSRNDKFYLLEVVRDGTGIQHDTLTDAPNSGSYTRREVIEDRQRFTLQFGKRLGMFQLRAGLKDSTFGAGADALLMEGRLRFSADIFGGYYTGPRLKLAAAFAVYRSLYILGGVDDALNPHTELPIVTGNTPVPKIAEELHYGRDYFVGAALYFTDEDITWLLRIYGALLLGLI